MVGAAGCHRSATVSSSGRLATADSRAVCTEILHHGDHPADETRGLGRESISTSELMAGMRRRAAVRRALPWWTAAAAWSAAERPAAVAVVVAAAASGGP